MLRLRLFRNETFFILAQQLLLFTLYTVTPEKRKFSSMSKRKEGINHSNFHSICLYAMMAFILHSLFIRQFSFTLYFHPFVFMQNLQHETFTEIFIFFSQHIIFFLFHRFSASSIYGMELKLKCMQKNSPLPQK